MKLIVVLYGSNCMVMPTLLGRSQKNYGRLHWNPKVRRHESAPISVKEWSAMLPDLAASQTGERWLVDILDTPAEEVSAPVIPEPEPAPTPVAEPEPVVDPSKTFRRLRKQCLDLGYTVNATDTVETLTAKLA